VTVTMNQQARSQAHNQQAAASSYKFPFSSLGVCAMCNFLQILLFLHRSTRIILATLTMRVVGYDSYLASPFHHCSKVSLNR